MFSAASSEAIDLIKSCFHFNPSRRPSAEELLKHIFVAEFHNEEEVRILCELNKFCIGWLVVVVIAIVRVRLVVLVIEFVIVSSNDW